MPIIGKAGMFPKGPTRKYSSRQFWDKNISSVARVSTLVWRKPRVGKCVVPNAAVIFSYFVPRKLTEIYRAILRQV